jgi:lipopolysaccharide/colanic/teichoic acid biosynthesis glycosyltransferase
VLRQRRVGLDGREFDLLKFRSMRMRTGAAPPFRPRLGLAPGGVEGEDRRTGLGKWLRRSNLDELPQLVNVLRGEMSLVGPRPERPAYVDLFTQSVRRYNDRHRVKAGITGWAQVNGLRGQTSIAERVEYDNYYVQHLSPALDLKILLLTGAAVLFPRRERVSEVGAGRRHERSGLRSERARVDERSCVVRGRPSEVASIGRLRSLPAVPQRGRNRGLLCRCGEPRGR